MKKIYSFVIPFLINSPTQSMIIQHKLLKSRIFNKINNTKRYTSTSQELYTRSQKLLSLNALAGVTGTILGAATGDPSYALPLIPHILSSINLCAHELKEKKPITHFEQDLEVLIKNKPSIIEEVYTIKKIADEIKNLQEEVNLTLSQLNRLHLMEDYENKIAALKQQKTNAIENLFQEMSPLFKLHKITDIAPILKNIKDNTPSIKAFEPVSFCFNIGYLIFVPINVCADGSFTDLALAFCLLNIPLTIKNIMHHGELSDKDNILRHEYRQKATILEILENLKQTHSEQFKKITE